MAHYWVFLNNKVSGPFTVEDLIRLRGFSRQTRVCVDDASGRPLNWISPAEIPELAHIFRAADEQMAAPVPAHSAKIPSKPAPVRAPTKSAPVIAVKTPSRVRSYAWVGWVLAACAMSGAAGWTYYARRGAMAQDRETARALVENAPLPASSAYATLQHYLQVNRIRPRWDFEKTQDALYHVTLSWYGRNAAVVYAFEANVQAQTVRGLNTAAIRLLSEGFPAPVAPKAKPVPEKKKSPGDLFAGAIEAYRQSLEGGDFSSVWDSFSQRKKRDMAKGGMSRDGYLRLQTLTHRVDSPMKQSLLKTKEQSPTERLVLSKQSQTGRPDIFVKQLWLFEEGHWVLDEEEKKVGPTSAEPEKPAVAAPSVSTSSVVPTRLPGMSN